MGARPAYAYTNEELAWLKADKGRGALLRGNFSDAESSLTAALRSSGLGPAARVIALEARGLARWRLRDLRAALEDFNAAIALSHEDAALYNNRGNVLLELGLPAEAAKDFAQAVALSPFFAAAYSNRGNARFVMGNLRGALDDYTVAIGLMPDNAAPFNGRGLTQLALRRPAAALRDLSRAIALKENYGQAHANRAEALAALNRQDDAAADYTAAIKLGFASAKIYLGRGAAYASMNRPRLALADYAMAAKLDATMRPPMVASVSGPLRSSGAPKAFLAPAALSNQKLQAPLPCDDTQHEAATEHGAGLHLVADASSDAFPRSFVYRTSGAADGALGHQASATGMQPATPCGPRGDVGEGSTADDLPELAAWSVSRNPGGDYEATLIERPIVRLVLEMYGEGEPELLHWQPLRGSLRGIGLLHYLAGVSDGGDRLEYIALIDTVSGRLIGIEPCQFGAAKAIWTWDDDGLVVVDPHGVPSHLRLRVHRTYDKPAHVKRLKQAKRRVPSRFAHKAKRHGQASHAANRQLPHRARFSASYRGYSAFARYGLK